MSQCRENFYEVSDLPFSFAVFGAISLFFWNCGLQKARVYAAERCIFPPYQRFQRAKRGLEKRGVG